MTQMEGGDELVDAASAPEVTSGLGRQRACGCR